MNAMHKYNQALAAELRKRLQHNSVHTTIVATLLDGTQRTTTFTWAATEAEILEDIIGTAINAPTDAYIVAVHIFVGTTVEVWQQEKVRERVYTVPAFLTRWETKPVYISGVLTGYRAERRGPFGYHETRKLYAGNMYVPGSFECARLQADDDTLDLNKREGL